MPTYQRVTKDRRVLCQLINQNEKKKTTKTHNMPIADRQKFCRIPIQCNGDVNYFSSDTTYNESTVESSLEMVGTDGNCQTVCISVAFTRSIAYIFMDSEHFIS